MHPDLWRFDTVTVDLEDRDLTDTAIHKIILAAVIVEFRLTERQLSGNSTQLLEHIECLVAQHVLDLASYLDTLE